MQERFDAIWRRFCMLYPEIKKFEQPKVVFNGRLKSTADRAIYMANTIELSKKLFAENEQEFWFQTIPHEFAHIVTHLIWGCENVTHHGPQWKSVMIAYGLKPDIYHNYIITK